MLVNLRNPYDCSNSMNAPGVNQELVCAGKFNKHVDLWDSNEDNSFFSFEGFMFVQRQIWNFSKPADLPTPEFCILKKFKKYELRR